MKPVIRLFVIYLALNSSARAIVNGEVDTGNIYSSVGYTLTLSGALGSLVALDPNWLLTAAHVVDDLATDGGSFLTVMGNPNTGGAEQFYLFYDTIDIPVSYVPGEFHDDLALIRLSVVNPIITDPMDISFADASFATLSNVDLTTGLPGTATITGYGRTEVLGLDPTIFLRNFGDAPTYTGDPFATVGVMPFDPGFPTDCAGGVLLCTYSTGEPPTLDAGGAPGDSGGAMFLDYGGGEVVAGINSFIFDENDIDPTIPLDWTDGYWTVGTSTAFYEGWIRGVVEGAGGTVKFGAAPVPLPPAFFLFAAGLVGVMGLSRRRSVQQ